MPDPAKPPIATQARDVLLVNEDENARAIWTSSLKIAGFTVHPMATIEGVWEALLVDHDWRGLVVDLGFLGGEATGFLDRLRSAGHVIPTLLTAWDEGVAKSKSALAYPALAFRPAPLQPRDLIAAVKALPAPPAKGGKGTKPGGIVISHRPEGIMRLESAKEKSALLPHAMAARAEAEKEAAEAARAPVRDAKMDRELAKAREIQARLLPETIPQPEGWEIAAQYLPAEEVGGDYYDVIEMSGGRVAVLVADVSGKGISAAMVMVMARTVFHAVAPHAPNAKKLLVDAAAKISRDLPGGMFLSLAGAVIDSATGECSIVNAGHMPPKHWVFDESGHAMVTEIDVAGGAIGLVKGPLFERTLRDMTITLQPGEQLVFYTDGVNEAMDEKNEEYGDKKLHLAVKKSGGSTADEMAQGIVDSVLYHRGDAPASDDITVLVVRRI